MIARFFEVISDDDSITIEIGPFQNAEIVVKMNEDSEGNCFEVEVSESRGKDFINLLRQVVKTYDDLD